MGGNYLAFGVIKDFREGWAVMPFKGEKAHSWGLKCEIGTGRLYRSACGIQAVATDKVSPLNQGNYPQCKRCLNSVGMDSGEAA